MPGQLPYIMGEWMAGISSHLEEWGMRALLAMETERAKKLVLLLLSRRWIGTKLHASDRVENPALASVVAGLSFRNPLGMAAGFDRDGEVFPALIEMGFGFVEIGTVTPLAQPGQAKPRLFRLSEDGAIINRMGFPGKGAAYVANRLESFRLRTRPADRLAPIGVNLGINSGTERAKDDYSRGASRFAALADYLTINVSSPNTKGLRDLQQPEQLFGVLESVRRAAAQASKPPPIFVKLSPDLGSKDLPVIIEGLIRHGLADGLIMTNTTTQRPHGLRSSAQTEPGGLSGRPLREISTEWVRQAAELTDGRLPIIGVGGIFAGGDVFNKISAGASLVQIYTGLVYRGPKTVPLILHELLDTMSRHHINHISDALGTDVSINGSLSRPPTHAGRLGATPHG